MADYISLLGVLSAREASTKIPNKPFRDHIGTFLNGEARTTAVELAKKVELESEKPTAPLKFVNAKVLQKFYVDSEDYQVETTKHSSCLKMSESAPERFFVFVTYQGGFIMKGGKIYSDESLGGQFDVAAGTCLLVRALHEKSFGSTKMHLYDMRTEVMRLYGNNFLWKVPDYGIGGEYTLLDFILMSRAASLLHAAMAMPERIFSKEPAAGEKRVAWKGKAMFDLTGPVNRVELNRSQVVDPSSDEIFDVLAVPSSVTDSRVEKVDTRAMPELIEKSRADRTLYYFVIGDRRMLIIHNGMAYSDSSLLYRDSVPAGEEATTCIASHFTPMSREKATSLIGCF